MLLHVFRIDGLKVRHMVHIELLTVEIAEGLIKHAVRCTQSALFKKIDPLVQGTETIHAGCIIGKELGLLFVVHSRDFFGFLQKVPGFFILTGTDEKNRIGEQKTGIIQTGFNRFFIHLESFFNLTFAVEGIGLLRFERRHESHIQIPFLVSLFWRRS